MDNSEKILITAYLSQSLDDIELTGGRIILHSYNEASKAGTDELENVKKAAKEFFEKKKNEIKELICRNPKIKAIEMNKKIDDGLALAGYIASLLEDNNIPVGPLNYIFISVWIIKKGIENICQEKDQ